MKRVNSLSNWVINSKQFYWIAFLLITASSLIQFILFLANVIDINNFTISELSNQTTSVNIKVWLRLTLSSIGSVLATLGLLMINRGNQNFYFYSLTASLILIINGLVSNLFFDALKWLFVGIVLLLQTIVWSKYLNKLNIFKIGWIKITALIVVIFIGSFLIGYFAIEKIDKSSFFYNKMPILDPIQFALTITGNIMMIFFIVESRIIYALGNIVTILMFGILIGKGDILSLTQLIQGLLYLIITLSGYIALKSKYIKENEDV